jgi:hypothetical protein
MTNRYLVSSAAHTTSDPSSGGFSLGAFGHLVVSVGSQVLLLGLRETAKDPN